MKVIMIVCNELAVLLPLVALKMGTSSTTTHTQLTSSGQLWCMEVVIKMKIRYESLCYRFVIEWVQIGNYMQFVCNNAVSNCDRWANITNLLPSTSTEVNQKMTLTDCIQSPHKAWFEAKVTSPRVVVAGLRITCEMTQALSNNAFTEILPECKQLAASRVPSTKETQMNWAHWCSLHSDWSAFIN